jgi:hypothetical protein
MYIVRVANLDKDRFSEFLKSRQMDISTFSVNSRYTHYAVDLIDQDMHLVTSLAFDCKIFTEEDFAINVPWGAEALKLYLESV